ncbi:sugar ABC transporter substrate-binding protein [Clostridium sp. DJ247]|uniref:ABC transporter substrate-binding protein n=1 Tax=Clostridium sp. DJ247 TaxID=2726188 RepID=UPI001A9B4704|nr:sugar ABC transporter substrate-binding protein [Clostridium sp. DJ247]
MKWKFKKNITKSLAILLAISLVSSCDVSNKIKGQTDEYDKSINLVAANHPWFEAVKPLIPDFESKTGIKVIIQSYPEDYLTAKLTVPLTGEWDTPDVFMYRPLQEGKFLVKNGWLESLEEYVTSDSSYDFNDFSKSAVGTATINNKLVGIPLITEQEILYYRKDLLEKAGVSVPRTINELQAAVQKLHNPSNGIYGFVARGQRSALVTQVSSFIYSNGGNFTKEDKATINTNEAVEAFNTYSSLLKNYSPSEAEKWSWPQAMSFFTDGKAAFYTDASSLYKNVVYATNSEVSKNIGYALFPAGKAGSKPYNVTQWVLGMNTYSKHKKEVWEFIKWATSKDIVLKTQQKGNSGARNSVWNKEEGTSRFPAELVSVIKESSKVGVGHDRPVVVSVGEARDVVGSIVEAAIQGKNVKLEADKANEQLQKIIDKDKEKLK